MTSCAWVCCGAGVWECVFFCGNVKCFLWFVFLVCVVYDGLCVGVDCVGIGCVYVLLFCVSQFYVSWGVWW